MKPYDDIEPVILYYLYPPPTRSSLPWHYDMCKYIFAVDDAAERGLPTDIGGWDTTPEK